MKIKIKKRKIARKKMTKLNEKMSMKMMLLKTLYYVLILSKNVKRKRKKIKNVEKMEIKMTKIMKTKMTIKK